ncbi:hypothetical protein BH11GEM1_BH11GEM1_29580 [soil metagenome]
MALDYSQLYSPDPSQEYATVAATLAADLSPCWLDEYYTMCTHTPNILHFEVDGFAHLFDLSSDPSASTVAAQTDDRLVAVFGYSQPPVAARDASRMRGFLGGGLMAADGDAVDKGHFIGHFLGGGTDVNLFPQRSELNRGWSDPGKVFRSMERAAAARPGTFVFARPLYTDGTWHPTSLEYGLLTADLRLWVERFSN